MKKSAIAIGIAAANPGPIRRKSISKKSQHGEQTSIVQTTYNYYYCIAILDTNNAAVSIDGVGVAQIRSNVERSGNHKAANIGSPNEFRKRFKGGKRKS